MSVQVQESAKENPMRRIRIEKVTVHIGVGKSGEQLEKARKVLEQLTGQKPCSRRAKRTVKDWGIRKGEPITCMVTLRKDKAGQFLKRAFEAVNNTLKETNFDDAGNFAFGVKEHIEIPGTKYNPELGIFGMDVDVTLERPGFRVKHRRIRPAQIGKKHSITKPEAVSFVKENFGTQIAGA